MSTGQHRRPTLRYRLGDAIARWFDRRTDHEARLDVEPIEPRPAVLDHVHQAFDATWTCADPRCGYRPADNPAGQRVVPVPAGEADWVTQVRS